MRAYVKKVCKAVMAFSFWNSCKSATAYDGKVKEISMINKPPLNRGTAVIPLLCLSHDYPL